MSRTLTLVLLSAALAGCDSVGGSRDRGVRLSSSDQLTLQIVAAGGDPPSPIDQVTIAAASIIGDRLALDIRYGGGCETHRLAAYTGPGLGDSNPPFAAVHLIHDANGDFCEALISRRIEIDLRPIRSFVAPSREVRIKVFERGLPSSAPEVLYQF